MIYINGHWTLVLTLLLVVFKLLEDFTITWWQATSPLWMGIPIVIIVRLIRACCKD